jgi:hypothetical protein
MATISEREIPSGYRKNGNAVSREGRKNRSRPDGYMTTLLYSNRSRIAAANASSPVKIPCQSFTFRLAVIARPSRRRAGGVRGTSRFPALDWPLAATAWVGY